MWHRKLSMLANFFTNEPIFNSIYEALKLCYSNVLQNTFRNNANKTDFFSNFAKYAKDYHFTAKDCQKIFDRSHVKVGKIKIPKMMGQHF